MPTSDIATGPLRDFHAIRATASRQSEMLAGSRGPELVLPLLGFWHSFRAR